MDSDKLFKAFLYLNNWKFEHDLCPTRYLDYPDRDGDGFWMDAGTNGIHRDDQGKHWRVGPFETPNECIIAMAELLPTVDTSSDYPYQ